MKYTKKDLGKQTFEFEITIAKEDVAKEFDHALDHLITNFEAEGFRKGNVPKEIAKAKISKEEIFHHAIEHLLPPIYAEIIKKEELQPITNPKIDLVSAKEGEDWILKISIAQKPEIKLADYKKFASSLKKDVKKDDIWVPGKDGKEPTEKEKQIKEETKKREFLNKVFEHLLEKSKIEISGLVIEGEVNNRLTQLIDDVRKIGMSIENYLKTKNETMESLKEKVTKEIEEMYKMEFILDKIAEDEKITVEEKDINQIIGNIPDEKQKEEAKKNMYFYAAMIKRQKTLDYLNSL